MKNVFYTIQITAILIFLSGCTASVSETKSSFDSNSINYTKYYKKYNGYSYDTLSEPMINYKNLADDAVREVLNNNKIPSIAVVTDFVDLSSLKNNSKMGYVLSNSIKNSLINLYKISVIEAEVSKYFKLSNNGLRLLSRDVDTVKTTKYDVDDAVVGTYTLTENELIVFVKLIDLKTGIIKGSYTNSLLVGKSTLIDMSYGQ